MTKQNYMWTGIAQAMGFEPREETVLAGRSGQSHQFNGLAIDDAGKRLLVFSGELDPRMAAMVHADAGANLSDYQLITVRPLTFDLQQLAFLIEGATGTLQFDSDSAIKSMENWKGATPAPNFQGATIEEGLSLLKGVLGMAGNVLMPFLRAAALSGLSPSEQIMLLVRQMTLLDWQSIFHQEGGTQRINLLPLARQDAQKWDREYGLCPFPLYELDESDWEVISSGKDTDTIRGRLNQMGVTQYFNPPKDHAALAMIDRGISRPLDIASAVLRLPEIGHPIANNEFLENSTDLMDMLGQMQSLGFTVEGEAGLTVSDKGKEFRASVKFRPREGAIAKVLNIVKVNLNLSPKDFH